ncbi:unnamed protein product [Sphagnum tenellum]
MLGDLSVNSAQLENHVRRRDSYVPLEGRGGEMRSVGGPHVGRQIVATETRLNSDGGSKPAPTSSQELRAELPYKRCCSEWCRNLGMQHQKAYTNCKAELPCNRHCPEWYGEAQGQIQHQKAYRNCKQNCHTKDIALNGAGKLVIAASEKLMELQALPTKDIAQNGMGKLRVKYNIRKLTGIAIQKTLH